MRSLFARARSKGRLILPVLVVLALFGLGCGARKLFGTSSPSERLEPPKREPLALELADRPNSVRVPQEVRNSLGMRKAGVEQVSTAVKPIRSRPLVMPGSTALDPARLVRMRVRFAPADVVEVGQVRDPHSSPGNIPPLTRDLQLGDAVHKGDLLAVLTSVDVGNKKNDLFDALAQLRFDQDLLHRAEDHIVAFPERYFLNLRHAVETDLNAVSRAENTLRAWVIPEADIAAVRETVNKMDLHEDRHAGQAERLRQWARVELRAPDDGFIIEQNVAQHETVVDNTTNLFQIAKVDPLIVLAAVPEDDLPALHALQTHSGGRIAWTVRTVGSNPIAGYIDDIGYLIDPNQHTAVVRGHISNPEGLLRAGQFVTASVNLLPPSDVVEVPIGAVVEDGNQSVVFVQVDANKPEYTLRRVAVTARFENTAYIRSVPPAEDEAGPQREASGLPIEPLREGERVLTAGALELKTALAMRQSEAVAAQN